MTSAPTAVPKPVGPVRPAVHGTTDDRLVMDVFMSQYQLPAVAVADRLGLFALLAEAPAAAAEVARRKSLDPHVTTVLLAYLAALGFLAPFGDRYHLTPDARGFLLPGFDHYWGPMIGLGWDERCTAVRRTLTDGVPYGYRGRPFWDTHSESTRHGLMFAAAMHAHSAAPAAALAKRLDLSGCTSLLEAGGGVGTFSLNLAHRNPDLRAVVLDLPLVERPAAQAAAEAGLTERVTFRPGDMFAEPWPDGQDRVLFADVLSDWGDDDCRSLLEYAHAALRPGGQVLIHQVLTDDSRHLSAAVAGYSLSLAVTTGGRLRTLPELGALLEAGGFTGYRAEPVYGHYALITAQRV